MALIYIVEDDRSILEIEEFALKNSGYRVMGFQEAKKFYTALKTQLPDLVLLDIMLPDEDGLTILGKIRNSEDTRKLPVIMVTAKTTEIDKVRGLDMGADDYMTKPFGVMELISRVKALLRRTIPQEADLSFSFGGIFEIFVGYVQELFTGTSSWNYADHWFNIAGKTSPRVMFVWGFICLVYMLAVYPNLSNLIEKIPPKIGDFIFWALLAFIIADCFISFSAVIRMNLRHHNIPIYTPYGRFLDYNYPDDRIHRAYPNMVELEE